MRLIRVTFALVILLSQRGFSLLPGAMDEWLAASILAQAPPGYELRLHPDGQLYVGDLISFEIILPQDVDPTGQSVTVQVDVPLGSSLGPADFVPFGIAGRLQATMEWAWDTRELQPGPHILTITIQPENIQWTEVVHLLPQDALPPVEAGAGWNSIESACCIIHTIRGTLADLDQIFLISLAEQEAAAVSHQLGAEFKSPVSLVLIPRLLGHGGFASNDVVVSYLDRNYAGNQPSQVLHHELVHRLDGQLGGELRPTILIEGLAVYLSGGHFKLEPLAPRAAALLALDWYLPLELLSDSFYPAQHEIGYLEAGALVEFMVELWGWEAFSAFYREIRPHPSGSQARALDESLQRHFGLTLSELEARFLASLRKPALVPDLIEDVRLTVRFYETVRRYQRALDPSAYFLTAWLPDPGEMRERGIVADYLRHPEMAENLAIEGLLQTTSQHLLAGRYPEAEQLLVEVDFILNALPTK